MSPSLRGRGLKSPSMAMIDKSLPVALFARAWIEIKGVEPSENFAPVALFARAWIEIGVDVVFLS